MHFLWGTSIASGIMAGLGYYGGFVEFGKIMMLTALATGLTAILFGIINKGIRVIIAGLSGILIALSVWAGYMMYKSSQSWLESIRRTGWVQPSDLALLKGVIMFFPLIASAAIFVMLFIWSRKGGKEYRPVVKPTEKKTLDVEICKVNGVPVILKHMDRYLHTMVVGTTGTGKSSRVLKPMIEQDLEAIAKGEKLGITVIEPKGDFADDVAAMCRSMKVPYIYINPLDPSTPVFNPMSGEP